MAVAIRDVLDRLAESERANDAHQMAGVLAQDFRFIGPAGFVLNGEQFVARFDGGNLKTTSFDLTGVDIREHGNPAVATGVWTQRRRIRAIPTTATSGSRACL